MSTVAKPMSREEFEEGMRQLQTGVVQNQAEDVRGQCMVCEGDVIASYSSQLPPGEMPIFGPGSRKQRVRVCDGFHCKACGIQYKFPPPKRP